MFQKYARNFLLLLWVLIVSCNPQQNEQIKQDETNKLLLISFDGFMNEYIERNETPNFDQLIANGVKAEYLIPIFPTKTFPTHYTIATGLYAENHGIISNSFPDKKLEKEVSYGPVDSPNDERWWGREPIWITAEQQGLTSATFFWVGSEAAIDDVKATKWMQYDESISRKARIDSMTTWMGPKGSIQADFGSLYFSFTDEVAHEYGPNSPEIDRAVQRADSLLGYLYKKMAEHHLSRNLNLIVTSDHGMAELSPERVIFLDEIIDLDFVEMVDWTPVALLNPLSDHTDQVYQSLKANEANYRVYLKENLPEHYHFSDHDRIPEIIMIADAGYTITSRDFFENRGVRGGDHGYDYQAPEMRTIFIANGPSFKKGEVVRPFKSVHIYELMCQILGLKPAENDGSLDSLKSMLR